MDDIFFYSLLFWSFVFGLLYKPEKTVIWVSVKPKRAPPPEAFEED
tara:strand:+ start:80 stop:217 length:138 start_codon:yes stop_codon:yes gene_type:complete